MIPAWSQARDKRGHGVLLVILDSDYFVLVYDAPKCDSSEGVAEIIAQRPRIRLNRDDLQMVVPHHSETRLKHGQWTLVPDWIPLEFLRVYANCAEGTETLV